MSRKDTDKAGPFGRAARLAMAICLTVITLPVYLTAGPAYAVASLGLTLGLAVAYVGLFGLISSALVGVNRWVLSVLAVLPVLGIWLLGQGGGPVFGQGEGGTAALTYLTVSFFVDFVRGGAGCEVLAVPSWLFGRRPDVPCLVLCPIDHAEAALRR